MASVTVISCHSHVSRPCCMLSAPPHFFLFNCPSGSTRYSSDQRLRIVRCTRIYISRLAEDCLGGLPGLLFCIQEARGSDDGVLLVGDFPQATDFSPLLIHEFRSSGFEALVCEREAGFHALVSTECGHHRGGPCCLAAAILQLPLNLKREQVQADTVWAQQDVPITVHAFMQTDATSLEPSPKRACQSVQGHCIDFNPCLSFYVRAADHPGKFDVQAAKKFALVPKLHYAALKRGETVTATDGVEVHASEVVAPPTPGKSFAIIDHNCCVPPVFTESACARALQFQPNTVLHFSPSMTPGVQTAVEFCPLAVHVGVWGAAVEMSSMCAGHAIRNMLCPHVFRNLASISDLNFEPPPAPLLSAVPGLVCELAPPIRFGWQPPPALKKENELVQELLVRIQQHRDSTPGDDVCTVLDASSDLPSPPSTAWRVTFLGTGGAMPSKYRNVSGILLSYRTSTGDADLTSMRHVLLDCGEGTLFQLVRLVGPVQASAIISALDFVWLSHAHADHHLGLIEVARDFFRSTGRPLKVFAPTKLFHRRSDPGAQEADVLVWLTLVSAMEGVPLEVSSCRELATTISDQASDASDSATAIRKHVPGCELLGVTAIRVEHSCYDAWAIRCTMPDGSNVVYSNKRISGDTTPCQALEKLGNGAELVIHEANFDDTDPVNSEAMIALAAKKKHSTTSGAIESCIRMNAGITALTHFSQRYPKVPEFAEHRNVFFAFDFSVLFPVTAPSGLQVHPQLHGALSELFATEDKEALDENA